MFSMFCLWVLPSSIILLFLLWIVFYWSFSPTNSLFYLKFHLREFPCPSQVKLFSVVDVVFIFSTVIYLERCVEVLSIPF